MNLSNTETQSPVLAMACMPKQEWCEPYELDIALKEGTIFPCLNMCFFKAPYQMENLPVKRNITDTNRSAIAHGNETSEQLACKNQDPNTLDKKHSDIQNRIIADASTSPEIGHSMAEKIKCSGTGTSLKSPAERNAREACMCRLTAVSFAINDLTLYLDTHPQCEKALTLYHTLMQERLDLLAAYAQQFRPLTQASAVTGHCDPNEYGWGEGPAPWEGACI